MSTHLTAKLVLCFGMHVRTRRIALADMMLELENCSLIVSCTSIIDRLGKACARGYVEAVERSGIPVAIVEDGSGPSNDFNTKRFYFGVLSGERGPNGYYIEYFKVHE